MDVERRAWVRDRNAVSPPKKKKKQVVDPSELFKTPLGFFACLALNPNNTVVKKKKSASLQLFEEVAALEGAEPTPPPPPPPEVVEPEIVEVSPPRSRKERHGRERRIATEPLRHRHRLVEEESEYYDDDELAYIAAPAPEMRAPPSYVRSRPRRPQSYLPPRPEPRAKRAVSTWDSATTALVF